MSGCLHGVGQRAPRRRAWAFWLVPVYLFRVALHQFLPPWLRLFPTFAVLMQLPLGIWIDRRRSLAPGALQRPQHEALPVHRQKVPYRQLESDTNVEQFLPFVSISFVRISRVPGLVVIPGASIAFTLVPTRTRAPP
jgi:hypothetical protein